MRRDIEKLKTLPKEFKMTVTTVITAGDYIEALNKGLGVDDIIKMGIRSLKDTPLYVARIADLEKETQHLGDNIMKIQGKLTEQSERIYKLEEDVKNLKDIIKIKEGFANEFIKPFKKETRV